MSLAFLFPGQGSQHVGMGKDFYRRYEAIFSDLFNEANEVLGFDLQKMCFQGPAEYLTATEVAQPAILTASVGVYRLLEQEGITPSAMAGHSVGQFSALVASSSLTFADALQIVRKRGKCMASVKQPGSMVAIVTSKHELMAEALTWIEEQGIDIAAYNAPNQIVLSGAVKQMNEAYKVLDEVEGIKAKKLSVSQAFHSRLMEEMEAEFMEFLMRFSFQPPHVPIVLNSTAVESRDVTLIVEDVRRQCTSPVRWAQTIKRLAEMEIEQFVEVGSSKTLSGLMRSFAEGYQVHSTESPMALAKAFKRIRLEGVNHV
ncbi:[acyl-carrier-protein] S-malonyltransferase [Thermoactinomyces sp. DSM 45891]|uniref:ACP S-malonyltransferase n=1 Tax=Thermoactinomyces sp. DSM 45891 TaxID=1761907 RepID=UPI00091A9B64|nr:ACP S-malonyltransferase [Thermoactinomyces sp. DSM 45891]SFW99732.1 [acyl-carrier-protein] S-malonyltransferase [Thermoactinomyces sp. DSM 45891]